MGKKTRVSIEEIQRMVRLSWPAWDNKIAALALKAEANKIIFFHPVLAGFKTVNAAWSFSMSLFGASAAHFFDKKYTRWPMVYKMIFN